MKKICLSILVILLSSILYPILIDRQVPFQLKLLHYRYALQGWYSGMDSNFSRPAVKQFYQWFSNPVNHSSDILIERLLIPSSRENDSHLIPVNIYINKTIVQQKKGKLPTLIYIHGGGWVFAPPENLFYERFTRKGLVFVEVRYRLSPEFKFPIPLEDCWDAILSESILKYTDLQKVAIMGDSAGGNLVSALLYMLRDKKTDILSSIKYQILIYPACGTLDHYPSKRKYNDWYILNDRNMKFYMNSYARDQNDFENPYFNVLKQKDLTGLPETYFILSERDYLFSEGEELGRRFDKEGDKTATVKKYDSEHSFFKLGLKESWEAYEDLMAFLKEKEFIEK